MRTVIAVAAVAAVSALAVGCGSTPAPGQPGAAATLATQHHPLPGVAATVPTLSGNRSLATREARRLMAKAVVPPGATPLRTSHASLPGPAMGIPGARSVVDVSRSWRLTMTLAQATAWLSAHPPRGLREDGSTGSTIVGVANLAGYSYTGPQGAAWASAELEAEVGTAPAGGTGSVLRVDAVVVWLDPVPAPDVVTGARLRVTVAGGCPVTDRGIVGVSNTGTDLRARLLPAAAPTVGIECFYYGLNGHPFRLRNQVRLDEAEAAAEAAAVASMPLTHVIGGVFSCPMADGSAEVIALSYPGRPDVDVWRTLNGCASTSNGFIETGLS